MTPPNCMLGTAEETPWLRWEKKTEQGDAGGATRDHSCSNTTCAQEGSCALGF